MLDGAHDVFHQILDLVHELFARQLARLHQLELVLPFPRELGRAELDNVQHVEREHQ